MASADINKSKEPVEIFPNTYKYITRQLKLSTHEFNVIVQGKCPQPFEQISSYEYLENTTEIPPKEAFFSSLRGDTIDNKPGISDESYNRFCTVWKELNITSLLHMMVLYAAIDAVQCNDLLLFYFEHLYRIGNIHPSYYTTSASFALAAALFNSKNPSNKNQPLKLPLIDEKFALLYNKGLTGGFSFTSSNYCDFATLDTETHKKEPFNTTLRLGILSDANQLYPSILSSYMPHKSFLMLSPTENIEEFKIVSTQLISGNIDFFYDQLFENQVVYFCEVEIDYQKGAELSFLNFELSAFPFYEVVPLNMLSGDQRKRANLLNRNPEKETKRLVSYLKKNNRVSQYAENLLYSRNIHDIAITQVFNIIKSTAEQIFTPWIKKLEKVKNQNISKLFNRVIKNLSNSIPGMFYIFTKLTN